MNNSDPNQTLAQLQQLGLVEPTAALNNQNPSIDHDEQNNHVDMPWFLQLFFGCSGLLASLLLVGFLTLILVQLDAFDRVMVRVIVAVALTAVGFILFNHQYTRGRTFSTSLAFTLSITGQIYAALALFDNGLGEPLTVWLLLLMQVLMTLIMPNFIYRLLSAIAALICVIYLLSFYHLPEVGLGLLALITSITNLQRYQLLLRMPAKWRISISHLIRAIAYASAVVLLSVSVYFIAAAYGRDFANGGGAFSYDYVSAQGLLILASLYTAYLILKRYQTKLRSKASLLIGCAIIVLGIMSVYVAGLLATSLVIVIAIANSLRVLLGLAVFALVGYIFWYYYQLNTSLLVKAGSMFIIGTGMLLMRWLLVKHYFAANAVLPDSPASHKGRPS